MKNIQNKRFRIEESKLDDLALTREYFISTPDGRMSVRMPEFIGQAEQGRRIGVIVRALNCAENVR